MLEGINFHAMDTLLIEHTVNALYIDVGKDLINFLTLRKQFLTFSGSQNILVELDI